MNRVTPYVEEDFETNAYQWRVTEGILGLLAAQTEAISARLILLLLPDPFVRRDLRFINGSDFRFRFDTPDGPRPATPVKSAGGTVVPPYTFRVPCQNRKEPSEIDTQIEFCLWGGILCDAARQPSSDHSTTRRSSCERAFS